MYRVIKRIAQPIYVDGFHLLGLCEKLVSEALEEEADGVGTAENPWTMSNPKQWIARWRRAAREGITYYKIAGRLISKNQKLYVGDVGPAWRRGVVPEDMGDKSACEARNIIQDPTYRWVAQRVVDPGLIYAESTRALKRSGGEGPSPWNELKFSPVIARAIRTLLKGEKLSLGKNTGRYDRHYSRKQFLLPVLTAAIFLAEPARNRRAWPINLMLLDLAEVGEFKFTWDEILWHPEAINPVSERVRVLVFGPQGRKPHQRQITRIEKVEKLHLVGGILPASPTGGGERGKPALYKPPKPLHPRAIMAGRTPGPGIFVKIPLDFIHQKEIDVLLKWMFRIPELTKKWSIVYGDTFPKDQMLSPREVLGASVQGNGDLTGCLQEIRTKIQRRINGFDFMNLL